MEATHEGVKPGSGEVTGGDLRVIPECRELSSLSSLPDDFARLICLTDFQSVSYGVARRWPLQVPLSHQTRERL